MVDTCTLYYTPYEYNQKQDIGFYLHQEGPNLGKIPCPCYRHSKMPSLGPLLRDTSDIELTLVLSLRACWVIVTDRWDDQVIFFQLDLFHINYIFSANYCRCLGLFVCSARQRSRTFMAVTGVPCCAKSQVSTYHGHCEHV